MPEKTQLRRRRAFVLFIASVAYGLFIFFILKTEAAGREGLAMLALYFYGFIGGIGILIVSRAFARARRTSAAAQDRAMAAAIHAEHERLKDFTDNAPVGLASIDADGRFLFANTTLLTLLKARADDVIGTARLSDFSVTLPPGDHGHGDIIWRDTAGGTFRALVTHSVSRVGEAEAITRLIVHDLTAEDTMRRALSESEGRFQRLVEEAPVGISILSSDGRIVEANQTLVVLLGARDDVRGQIFSAFIADELRRKFQDWLAQPKGPLEVTFQGERGIIAQLYARPFSGGQTVVYSIDLTEQKNLERKFSQSQKMQAVGQLAGGVAHDFNNLLTAMIGFSDLLLLRHKPGDASFADIMQIKQNANRAAGLVRQLLAFSRQQTLQPRVLDMADVLAELSHLLRRLIGTNIDLVIEHGHNVGLIRADQGQMEQVLINLAVNARDAMPQGGKLTIRTGGLHNPHERRLGGEETLPPGDWVTITVEDAGTGIPPDVLPHIFEPFFTTKAVGAGTGLGLATAHGIVHQTGGAIAVESTLGKGTAFTLYIPRHVAAPDEKPAPEVTDDKAAPGDLTGSAKILLVEDEDAVRVFSARALSNKGYRVVDAPSAKVALHLLDSENIVPDILITDVMMPEMDGTTLAKIVREKYPTMKIIFISGFAEDRFKEHLGDGVHFLPKPFTLKQLATKVKALIEE